MSQGDKSEEVDSEQYDEEPLWKKLIGVPSEKVEEYYVTRDESLLVREPLPELSDAERAQVRKIMAEKGVREKDPDELIMKIWWRNHLEEIGQWER